MEYFRQNHNSSVLDENPFSCSSFSEFKELKFKSRISFLCILDDAHKSDPKGIDYWENLEENYDYIFKRISTFELPKGIENPYLYKKDYI